MNRPSAIQGCYPFELTPFQDARGSFLKVFQQTQFKDFSLKESFFSVSNRGVIRGMHFQVPPKDHDKIVICVAGRAFDVVLDLRKASPSFGTCETYQLESSKPWGIFIPRGCAHGFQALEENTALLYLTTQEYDRELDRGIRWDSLESVQWPLPSPTLSTRDESFPPWQRFESPF